MIPSKSRPTTIHRRRRQKKKERNSNIIVTAIIRRDLITVKLFREKPLGQITGRREQLFLFCGSCCSPRDTSCSATSVMRHFIKHRHTIMSFYSCRRPTPFHSQPPAVCHASLFVPSSIQSTSSHQRQIQPTAGYGGGINHRRAIILNRRTPARVASNQTVAQFCVHHREISFRLSVCHFLFLFGCVRLRPRCLQPFISSFLGGRGSKTLQAEASSLLSLPLVSGLPPPDSFTQTR